MRQTVLRSAAVVSLALWAVACDRGRITSFSPTPVIQVRINGPDSVPPGETIRLSATAVLPDGTTRVVTDDTTWRSSNAGLLSIESAGVVRAGQQRGEGEIRASYAGAAISLTVYVLPAGTFVVSGSVSDDGVPINGAEVDVTAGLGAGLSATANPSFRLYGVGGDTEIRVSKAGYETQVRRTSVTRHEAMTFDLVPSAPRLIVSGMYTLGVVAAAECRNALPDAARARTYAATIEQAGARLTVMLGGAQLESAYGPSKSFEGLVEPNRLSFSLAPYSGDIHDPARFQPPSVAELITLPNTYFTFSGSVVAYATANGYAGTLDGNIEVLKLSGPWDLDDAYTRLASCRSTTHQFTLVR